MPIKRNTIHHILATFVAFVFLQSLFFKFAGLFGAPADITVYIFSTIGTWIKSLGLASLGENFTQYGGWLVGLIELVASLLILIPKSRLVGALIGFGIMSGAIFFHVFTPLGLFPYTDLQCLESGCPQETALFFMAIGVWSICAYFIALFFNTRSTSSADQI